MKKYLYENKFYTRAQLDVKKIPVNSTVTYNVIIPPHDSTKEEVDMRIPAIEDSVNKTLTYHIRPKKYWAVFDSEGNHVRNEEHDPIDRYPGNFVYGSFENPHYLKLIDGNWAIENFKAVPKEIDKVNEKLKKYQLAMLAKIFSRYTSVIEEKAIDKSGYFGLDTFETNSTGKDHREYVSAQYKSYKAMYEMALRNPTDPTNEAIISAHETSEARVAPLIFASNKVRADLTALIVSGAVILDKLDILSEFKINNNESFETQLNNLMSKLA